MSFFLQLKDSVSRPMFYTTVYKQDFGKTLKYLFLLFLITFIVWQGIYCYRFLNTMGEFINLLDTNIPNFSLNNGKLHIDGKQPIYLLGNNIQRVVIDTTGNTSEDSLSAKPGDYVLITETQVISKQSEQRQVQSLSQIPININKAMIMQNLPYLNLILVFITLATFFVDLTGRFIWTTVLSLGALVINACLSARLKYSELYNISVYALTLPIVLELFKNIFGSTLPNVIRLFANILLPSFPFFSLIYWGVGLMYIYLALRAIRDKTKNELAGNTTSC